MKATVSRSTHLATLLAEVHAGCGRDDPLAALRLRFALRFDALGIGAQAPRLQRAQRELARLHLAALARLCRSAIDLREESSRVAPAAPRIDERVCDATLRSQAAGCASDGGDSASPVCAPSAVRVHGSSDTAASVHLAAAEREREPTASGALASSVDASSRLAAWRADFCDALQAAVADGARASGSLRDLLRGCCAARPEDWPDTLELARAAVALAPSSQARLDLVRRLSARGKVAEAAAVAVRSLLDGAAAPWRAELIEALAQLLERCGRPDQADALRRGA